MAAGRTFFVNNYRFTTYENETFLGRRLAEAAVAIMRK
jgi:hypothetical protein